MTKFYSIDKKNKRIEEIYLSHQAFSGTDTCQESGKLGIVYPFDIDEDIKGFVTASSIIDHHNDDSHLLKHTEVRIANKEGDSLEYQRIDNTVGIVLHSEEIASKALNTYFGLDKFQSDSYCQVNDTIREFTPDSDLEEAYKASSTEVIISDKNLEKKVYKYGSLKPFGFGRIKENKKMTEEILNEAKKKKELKEQIDNILKPFKIDVKIDLDEFFNYIFDFEQLYPYERSSYNGFLEYMLFDIDSEIEETIEDYRKKKKYSEFELFNASDRIRNLIFDEYKVERTLF